MCSKGDQLKVKLANLKFSDIGDGPLFLVFGGRLVIGGKDYIYNYIYIYTYIYTIEKWSATAQVAVRWQGEVGPSVSWRGPQGTPNNSNNRWVDEWLMNG